MIGISLEKEFFRAAVLKRDKNNIAVASLHAFPYGPDNVKLFYNLPPFHAGKGVRTASGLASDATFLRKLHLPLKDRRKLLAALPFQLEGLLPFEDAVVCPLFQPLGNQMTSVTVFAARKESLEAHIAALKDLDIEPETVSCAPMALARFGRWAFPNEPRLLIFDAREGKIACVLCEGSEVALSQTLFARGGEEIACELDKFLMFLKQKGGADETTPWLLCGEKEHAEVFRRIFTGPQLEVKEEEAEYALAIGFALDALAGDGVQFCQGDFTPGHLLGSRKKKIFSYAAACLAAALLTAGAGHFMIASKQRAIAERLRNYAPALAKADFSSADEIRMKLVEWEKTLGVKKTPFALIPNVPKVSDVLAWLSAHPSFAEEDGGKREGVEFKSLHYRLLKYPRIGEGGAPYIGQVDVEFTSAAPRAARDFHEALLKGDQIVNGKKEVKWQAQNQTYHASFELMRKAAQ